jgi:hypothetical protein
VLTDVSATVLCPMEITVASDDGRESMRLEVDVASEAEGLVLVDEVANEYHFGCGMWVKRGTFLHVATYSPSDGFKSTRSFGRSRMRSRSGGCRTSRIPN